MKKFLKGLIITLVVLVTLAAGTVIGAYFLISDDETAGFHYDQGADDFQTTIGKSLDASIETIKDTNYATNEIDVDFTMQDITNFVAAQIQQNDPEYLNGKDYIAEASGFQLNSVYAVSSGSDIEIIACASYQNFIKTAFHANANVTLEEGNKLLIQLNSIRIGKYMNFGKDVLTSLVSLFGGALSGFEGFDPQNLTFTYNFSSMLDSALSDPIAKDLMNSLTYTAKIEDSKLVFSMDTSKLFTGERTCPSYGPGDTTSKFEAATAALIADPTSQQTITLTESEFNNLVMGDMEDEVATFQTSIPVNSTYTFPATLADPYYTIADQSVSASFGITSVTHSKTASSSGHFTVGIEKSMSNSGDLSSVTMTVNAATVGSAQFKSVEGFDFVFDIAGNTLLAGYPLHIKDLSFDPTNSTASIVVAAM